jgi:hypothetical protein
MPLRRLASILNRCSMERRDGHNKSKLFGLCQFQKKPRMRLKHCPDESLLFKLLLAGTGYSKAKTAKYNA